MFRRTAVACQVDANGISGLLASLKLLANPEESTQSMVIFSPVTVFKASTLTISAARLGLVPVMLDSQLLGLITNGDTLGGLKESENPTIRWTSVLMNKTHRTIGLQDRSWLYGS